MSQHVERADPVAYCVACGKFVAVDMPKDSIEKAAKQHVLDTEHEVIIGHAYCLVED